MGCTLCQPPPLHKLQICGRGCNGESCDPCRELDALQARISKARQDLREAEKVLATLFAQQHDLQEDVNRCHDPVCSQLPPEIVSSIFQLYVPETKLDNNLPGPPKPAMEAVKATFTLGTVCRNWRRIAWSTPHLWKLVLVQLHTPESDLHLYCIFIHKWLQRSGQLSLDIVVYCRSGFFVSSEGDVNCSKLTRVKLGLLVKMIRLESGRWSTLDLRIPQRFTSSFFSDLLEPPLTLQTLRLETDLNDHSRGAVRLPNDMPRLQCIFLRRWFLSTVQDIQWSNIIYFEAAMYLGPAECMEILQNAPRLRQCKIRWALCRSFEPSNVLVHHQLEVLELQSERLEVDEGFFDYLELPALRTLKLESTIFGYLDVQQLISFFVRSSCPLTTFFVIGTKRLSLSELSGLLRTIPSLIELHLFPKLCGSDDADSSTDQFFDLLARTSVREGSDSKELIPEVQECLLPNLQTLHCSVAQPFSFDHVPPVFGPISEFGNPFRRPLKVLHLHADPNVGSYQDFSSISEESAKHLVAALEAGLEFKVYPVTFRKVLRVAINRSGVLGASRKLTKGML